MIIIYECHIDFKTDTNDVFVCMLEHSVKLFNHFVRQDLAHFCFSLKDKGSMLVSVVYSKDFIMCYLQQIALIYWYAVLVSSVKSFHILSYAIFSR